MHASPGAEELRETNLTSFFTHLFVDKMGLCELGVSKERQTSDQFHVCLKNVPIFPLATAQKMLSNTRTLSQAQPIMLIVFLIAPRGATFPVQTMSQVYMQQERSNIISLAAPIC